MKDMMRCGCRRFCMISFGLALGITFGLAVLICSFWAMYYGPTQMMTTFNIPVPTVSQAFLHSLWALIKGFVIGFFIALFYNLFTYICPCCRGKCRCCHKLGPTDEAKPPEVPPEVGR